MLLVTNDWFQIAFIAQEKIEPNIEKLITETIEDVKNRNILSQQIKTKLYVVFWFKLYRKTVLILYIVN